MSNMSTTTSRFWSASVATPWIAAMWLIALLLSTTTIVMAAAAGSEVDMVTVNATTGSEAFLPCRNATPGSFYGIVWTVTTDSFPRDVYSYLIDHGKLEHGPVGERGSLVNGTSLSIKNISAGDAGAYHCNLIYFLEPHQTHTVMVSSIVQLQVIVPPKIVVRPSSQIVSLGNDVAISCSAVGGNTDFKLTWTRNDSLNLSALTNDVHAASLRLTRVVSDADGVYKCLAQNEAGVAVQYARVIVRVPPFILDTKPVHINVAQSGRVNCIARGYPPATFRWQFKTAGGDVVTMLSGANIVNKYRVLAARNSSRGSVSSLVLKDVNKNDFGVYTCHALNSVGESSRNLSLTGYTYASKPVIVSVRTSSNKAVVVWDVADAGGTKLQSLTLKYRNETKRTAWKSIQITPATVESYTIMDLVSDMKYEFKMFATNEVGDSPVSATVTAWTKKPEGKSREQVNSGSGSGGLLGNLGLTALIGIVAGAFLAMLIAVIIVLLLVRRLQKTTGANQTVTPPHSRPASMENGSNYGSRRPSTMPFDSSAPHNTMEMEPLLLRPSQHDQWEFPRSQLRVSTVLGTGAFGMVMRGDAQGINGALGVVNVAIKMVRDSTNDTAKKDLQAELDLLKLIPEHPNVVGLKGCCSIVEPLMVIVEYCANGDLQGFLRSSRGISERYYRASYGGSVPNLTSRMLLTFANHVAKGMSHLASLKVIHRDLAARNILVDERLVCKVSDFGFARDVYVEDHYMKKSQGGRFPIKWMAIESLIDGISTTKSDVWSFGVVLWEIVTLGASPYPGMNSYEVVSFLQDGYRMEKPKHCSEEVYSLLLECWNVAPQRRRSFCDLAVTLKKMSEEARKEFINMSYYQDHLYENFDVSLTGQSTNAESEVTPPPPPPTTNL